jgi:hypothetical protein
MTTNQIVKFLFVLIVIVVLGFGFWYFNQPKASLPISATTTTTTTTTQTQTTVSNVTNCGSGVAPKLGVLSSYENNIELACLGSSALNCVNAVGLIKDDFLPTIFEITKLKDSCNFKLSYPADSTLTDITGKKLAGQSISCPISIVKAIDTTNATTPKFIAPSKTDLSKYASDIYFYGTLGLFLENNIDPAKIEAAGCSGDYIASVIAGFNLAHPK